MRPLFALHRTDDESVMQPFPLYNEENEGEEILVAEYEGNVVGYALFTGNQIHFIESSLPGAGRALLEWFKQEFEELVAINCVPQCRAWWVQQGFEPQRGADMIWYKD